jgi:hypothetical protein
MGTCVPSPVRVNTFPVVFTSFHLLRMVHRHCRWCTALGQHDDLGRTLTLSLFLQFVLNFERGLAEEYHLDGNDVWVFADSSDSYGLSDRAENAAERCT